MGIFGWSYPPGVTSLPDDEPIAIDLTEQLQAMGKKGHGLCGKDADLAYGGQIKVEGCFLLERAIEARLIVYATICPSELNDGYDDLVSTWDWPSGVTGEWDSDYWTFNLKNDEHFYRVKIPFKWNDRHGDKANYDRAVNQIYKAIWKDVGILAFQDSATELAKAGEK